MSPRFRAHEIRRRFLDFFASQQHAIVPSSALVPANDPTLLFTNAGMVQFKDTFLGRDPRPYARAVSVQRCLRAGGKHNDLDNVGFTDRHHTLFEMLGNFSFGDYFKKDAIRWGWELLTKDLGIPADKLVVSVFSGEGESAPADDEAFELWTEYVPRDRIYRLPAKENFWAMGDTGPCGPCSEIHIFHGDQAPGDAQKVGKYGPAYEDTRYTELWNLVFMQYEKKADGSMALLPRPCVDTGAGLERLAAVLEGVGSNYRTSLLAPLVDLAKKLAGAAPDDLGAGESPFRVIADHARATAFLIADGVFPEKVGRSYVLRRIMRRRSATAPASASTARSSTRSAARSSRTSATPTRCSPSAPAPSRRSCAPRRTPSVARSAAASSASRPPSPTCRTTAPTRPSRPPSPPTSMTPTASRSTSPA
jgi:alanyl-tRNA synthetase